MFAMCEAGASLQEVPRPELGNEVDGTEFRMHPQAKNLILALLLLLGSGCGSLPRWVSWQAPWRRPAPCTFPQNATREQIVAHVSRFATADGDRPALSGWRAMGARISFPGAPAAVPATIDVEGPSRLRIRASMFVSNSGIADIGCNGEQVWFWHREDPEKIVTIRHEHLSFALQQMPVPFDPDWLMEILGVAPMDLDQFELRRPEDEKAKWVDLVAQHTAPSGEPVLRVIRFNLCYGQIVAHRIERPDGTLIAAAHLDNYAPDVSGKFMMPHFVQLEWPGTNATLRLDLGQIHANPTPLADADWNVPHIPGTQVVQLQPPVGAATQPPYYESPETGEIAVNPPALGGRLSRDAFVDPGTRMDINPDEPSANAQPAGYSRGASRSSSGQRRLAPESGPPPFPGQP